jgi:hypothetical protein
VLFHAKTPRPAKAAKNVHMFRQVLRFGIEKTALALSGIPVRAVQVERLRPGSLVARDDPQNRHILAGYVTGSELCSKTPAEERSKEGTPDHVGCPTDLPICEAVHSEGAGAAIEEKVTQGEAGGVYTDCNPGIQNGNPGN